MRTPEPLVEIVSTGRYLPEHVVSNADMEALVDTSDEWIRERTGIRERRIADRDTSVAYMGAESATFAMKRAGVEPEDVDLLIVSTATPDRLLPSTACDIQAVIGANKAVAFDLAAACSGFLYGLSMAEGYITAGRAEVALVVSTEKMSSIIDWEDRGTCVLFGDGSGAAVVKRSDGSRGIVSSYHRSDGRLAELLHRPGGGAALPLDAAVLANKDHLVKMSGRGVFKNAVRCMVDGADTALKNAGLTGSDIDLMIPHQANIRIIEATAKYSGIPDDKVFVNVDRYGNMSSATIPVAMDEAVEQGRLQSGMNVLAVAFGAGFTWGGMVLRW
ncbi:MAG: ketoacyl-ACP synthase III [Gemmatimonadota bacterium]|nr:MAG: ketoacyl-ACP synthase III [Gemmatimonadota bacterium]